MESREALAAALPVARVPVETLVWFLTEVSASPLRGPGLTKILARLREYEVAEDDYLDSARMSSFMALLEVRAPDRLLELLHHWVEHREGDLRDLALLLLVRLGDTRFVPDIIELLSADDSITFEAGWLGRVKDPRVEVFLEERVRVGGTDSVEAAMAALAVWHGLPERVGGWFFGLDPETTASEVFVKAREQLLEGDAVGAALLLMKGSPNAEALDLGVIDDRRAVEALKRLRSDRGHHWEATAGLVLAGDADARRELTGLFLDGRTWIFYPVQDGRVFTFGMDPAWIDFWVDRIDATCCIGFSALETLGQLFPMLCTREVGCRTEVQDLIVRWWRDNRDHLAYSRILDGWVTTR